MLAIPLQIRRGAVGSWDAPVEGAALVDVAALNEAPGTDAPYPTRSDSTL